MPRRPSRVAFGAQVPRVSSLRLVGYFLALLLALAATTWTKPAPAPNPAREVRDSAVLLQLAEAEIKATQSSQRAVPATVRIAEGAGAAVWSYRRDGRLGYRLELAGHERLESASGTTAGAPRGTDR